MIHGLRSIFTLLILLLLGCGPVHKEEDSAQFEFHGKVDVIAGKNRILIKWDNVNNQDAVLQFVISGDRILEVEHSTSGQEFVGGLSEGSVSVVAQLVDGGKVLAELKKSVDVLGTRYEAGLQRWAMSEYSYENGVLKCTMATVVYGGLYAEEFIYTDAEGEIVEYSIRYDAAKTVHMAHIDNVAGGLKRRTVYMPEEAVGDFYYTSYTDVAPKADVPSEYVCKTVDGYRGIWFDLGQSTDYGSKYCGGLGTYTMKHIPMAIYSKETDKTFFVYGGTTKSDEKHLLCMIGCYDHATGLLQKPRIVMDKWEQTKGVNDPHDDPTVQIDKDGYLWVFVSGRSTKRDGRVYKSMRPYDITAFELISEFEMAYPQIMYSAQRGFFFFFTKYTGTRRLYYKSSVDGLDWTETAAPTKGLADIKAGKSKSGHYQISNICGNKLCTAFNRHINGDVDTRTNIYYVQSTDWGQTWTTVDGKAVTTPVTERESNCMVRDYENYEADGVKGRNCYIKDLNFDVHGNPIILYVLSLNHKTGPEGGEREWHVLHWDGQKWNETMFTKSTHCYDSGSIWVDGNTWTIIAPTMASSDKALYWGAGGEIQEWTSTDSGKTWTMTKQWTSNSGTNHTYIRRPFYADEGFWAYWADGRTDKFSQSNLYFGTKDGKIYRMPYDMTDEWQAPEEYN